MTGKRKVWCFGSVLLQFSHNAQFNSYWGPPVFWPDTDEI